MQTKHTKHTKSEGKPKRFLLPLDPRLKPLLKSTAGLNGLSMKAFVARLVEEAAAKNRRPAVSHE
jgi:hypothetical protein